MVQYCGRFKVPMAINWLSAASLYLSDSKIVLMSSHNYVCLVLAYLHRVSDSMLDPLPTATLGMCVCETEQAEVLATNAS